MFNAIVVTLGFLAFPTVCVWIIAVINYGAVVSNAAIHGLRYATWLLITIDRFRNR